jgi:aspartokinase-like uncharacterized kinase
MTIDTVVKIGGALVADPSHLSRVLDVIGTAATHRKLLLVPGGGPFADTVRDVDRRLQLSDDAAHWMAILAMDQHAHLLASRLNHAAVVEWPPDILALGRNQIPILAPSRWLRQADPLPHSWDVTSDSIAAWVSREIGAAHLLIVKRAGAVGPSLVDAHFARVLSPDTSCAVISADQIDALKTALHRTNNS